MSDVIISKQFPAVQLEPSETPSTYFEDIEINGQMYRAQNATFDQTDQVWRYYASGEAYAIVQNTDGSISHLSAPDGASAAEISWGGNGQRGVFDIRDYGALGDGSDDTVAIQSAASAASESPSGGIVYVPAGTYTISAAILLGNGVAIIGDGPGVSVLLASSVVSLNGGVYGGVLNIAMIANSTYLDSIAEAQTSIFVRGIGLQGTATNNVGESDTTIVNGLITFIGVNGQGVFDCLLQSSSNDGIMVSGSVQSDLIIGGHNVQISGCQVDLASDYDPSTYPNVNGSAIHCTNMSQGSIIGNRIGFGNQLAAVSGDAINCPTASDIAVTANQMTACQAGVVVTATGHAIVRDNLILNSSGTGITAGVEDETTSSHLIIVGNVIDQAAISTGSFGTIGAEGGGIAVLGSSSSTSKIVVADNTITLFDEATSVPTAIALTADGVQCHHNAINLGSLASTAISVSGSYNVINGNAIANGDTADDGATAVMVFGSPIGTQIINNSIVEVYTAFAYDALTNLQACVVRGNDGINPFGAVPAPTPTLETLTENPYPFDCFVYVSSATGFEVEIQGVPTNLGAGAGYLVPQGGSITLHRTTGTAPHPTWVWIAN